jgi:TetR/AcrR family transcriptional repressor of nem operon
MDPEPAERASPGGARSKLLEAAISIIRKKGYAATSVDELCAWAGVTKGAFFHHFSSKDALAVAATNHWTELSDALFAAAPYHRLDDPLARILGYLDFRRAMLRGEVAEFTCLAGTMVQETYGTHPDIRDACDASIGGHADKLESDIADAMKLYRLSVPWTAESLALHTQVVLQGAFILAKAKGSAEVAEASIDHLRRYIELLFRRPGKKVGRKPLARTQSSPRRRQRSTARARAAYDRPLTAGVAARKSNPACLIRHGVGDLIRREGGAKQPRRRRRGREPTHLPGQIREDHADRSNVSWST